MFSKHLELAQAYLKSQPLLHSTLSVDLDLTEFRWAWLVVNSRCIYQTLSATSARDDNYACSPLIDMINHVPSSAAHCKLSYDIRGLSVFTQSQYTPGQEVSISYGAHSNEALLCEYGFTLHRNTDDSVSLDATISARLKPWHIGMLMELGYYEDYTMDYQGFPSFRTEVALRVALLSESECAEESSACRRLTQFVDGQSSGRSEQHKVDQLLIGILEEEMKIAEQALTHLHSMDSGDSRIHAISRLWADRQAIIHAAFKGLDYSGQ